MLECSAVILSCSSKLSTAGKPAVRSRMTIINLTGQHIAKPEAVPPTLPISDLLATIADTRTGWLEVLRKIHLIILLDASSRENHILSGSDSSGHVVSRKLRVFNDGAQSNCTAQGENEKERKNFVHSLILWFEDDVVIGCMVCREVWLDVAETLQATDKVYRCWTWVYIDQAVAVWLNKGGVLDRNLDKTTGGQFQNSQGETLTCFPYFLIRYHGFEVQSIKIKNSTNNKSGKRQNKFKNMKTNEEGSCMSYLML